jgi:hypothetical protein
MPGDFLRHNVTGPLDSTSTSDCRHQRTPGSLSWCSLRLRAAAISRSCSPSSTPPRWRRSPTRCWVWQTATPRPGAARRSRRRTDTAPRGPSPCCTESVLSAGGARRPPGPRRRDRRGGPPGAGELCRPGRRRRARRCGDRVRARLRPERAARFVRPEPARLRARRLRALVRLRRSRERNRRGLRHEPHGTAHHGRPSQNDPDRGGLRRPVTMPPPAAHPHQRSVSRRTSRTRRAAATIGTARSAAAPRESPPSFPDGRTVSGRGRSSWGRGPRRRGRM